MMSPVIAAGGLRQCIHFQKISFRDFPKTPKFGRGRSWEAQEPKELTRPPADGDSLQCLKGASGPIIKAILPASMD